ncbi:MAG: hypothetical protein ABI172_10675 [Ginsengibacter sp.]
MKKFLLLILTFAYLASSSGATVYMHECMGKVIEWDLSAGESSSCAKCGMHKNEPNDCCKDQVKVLKVHVDQNLPTDYFSNFIYSKALLPRVFSFSEFALLYSEKNIPLNYLPPRSSKISYSILYCTFLI